MSYSSWSYFDFLLVFDFEVVADLVEGVHLVVVVLVELVVGGVSGTSSHWISACVVVLSPPC